MPIANETLLLGFHGPIGSLGEQLSIEVLNTLLFSQPTGALQRALTQGHGPALELSGWLGVFAEASLIELMIIAQDAPLLAQAREAVLVELEHLAQRSVEAAAMTRAVRLLELRHAQDVHDVVARLDGLGAAWVTHDDPAPFVDRVSLLRTLTPADLQRAAARYLDAPDVEMRARPMEVVEP
jgi:predicted Zn-dependent peptidase